MLRLLVISLLSAVAIPSATGADLPNILWLSAEDISPHLGCYGDPVAKTPTLDDLAARGIRYDNACTHAPVCSIVRSGVITGVYPVSLGTHHHRSRVKIPREIRCFTEYLREAGYYCTNNSKQDYNFKAGKKAWDASSGKGHWKNRAEGQPFFAVFNYMGTHESRFRGQEGVYQSSIKGLKAEELVDPATVVLPPYHPDTPVVRKIWAKSYNTIARLDHWVADRLKELQDAGLAEETIVVFWSDHGTSMPRGKRWLYDSGVRIPLIVYVPQKYQSLCGGPVSGTATDELVSSIDFAPTMLNLAGLPIPDYMQGRAFLGPDLGPQREHLFLHRDRMDERYDLIRSIRTKRYKYIRNFMPWRTYAQWTTYGEANPVMKEWRRLHAEKELTPAQAAFFSPMKPIEELYDLAADPHETNNLLATSEDHETIRADLAKRLQEEMRSTRDLGLVPEAVLQRDRETAELPYNRFRDESGADRYDSLLRYAQAASKAMPESAPGETAMALGMSIGFHDPAISTWATRVFAMMDESMVQDRIDVEQFNEFEQSFYPLWQDATVRAAAGEAMLSCGRVEPDLVTRGVEHLITVLDSDADMFDRIQAANALDTLPLLREHIEQIGPALKRVRREVGSTKDNGSPAGMLKQCVTHLAKRLQAED